MQIYVVQAVQIYFMQQNTFLWQFFHILTYNIFYFLIHMKWVYKQNTLPFQGKQRFNSSSMINWIAFTNSKFNIICLISSKP